MAKKRLFPVAPSAANAVGPLTQPTGPAQWNQGLNGIGSSNPQELLNRLRQSGGMTQATIGGPAPMSPETLAGVQASVGASPARQERLAMASRAPATKFIDGQGYMPNGRPAYGSGARNLQTSRVGAGTMSNGMTGGGAIGSSLMRGRLPASMEAGGQGPVSAALTRQQPELPSKPMQYGVATDQDKFAEAWKNRKMTTSDPAKQAAAQEKRAEEMDLRQALVGQRGIQKGQNRTDRLEFQKDVQKAGLIGALTKRGIDPVTVMAQQEIANGGPQSQEAIRYLSEANRQAGVRGEFADRNAIERERLGLDRERQQFEQNWLQGQPQPPAIDPEVAGQLTAQAEADYNRLIEGGMNPQTAAQQVQQRYSTIQPGFTFSPYNQPAAPTSLPKPAGVPQAVIDEMRASGDPAKIAAADEAERRNRELEEAQRRAGWGGLRGLWDDWWNVK
jgi:hypothetical protein